MTSNSESFWELLKAALYTALDLELYTPAGRINLIFGIVSVGLVALFLAGKGVESIGNLMLRLFGKRGRAQAKKEELYAILSIIVFFILSLFLASQAVEAPGERQVSPNQKTHWLSGEPCSSRACRLESEPDREPLGDLEAD